MKIGLSLSPGGLLLPYHLGVLDSLEYNKVVTLDTPVAGSSAGAIATASHACGVDSKKVLEATIDISDRCEAMGGARGRLLPLLEEKLKEFISEEEFLKLQERPGSAAVAYKELFPFNRNILQHEFDDTEDLIKAVCHSSMFPFFTTNLPFAIDTTSGLIPRLVVDGFFTVPRERFGCPDLSTAGIQVDRTVCVSPFPKEMIGLSPGAEDVICPSDDGGDQAQRLLRVATQSTSRKELTDQYESGWLDAEKWFHEDAKKTSVDKDSTAALN